MGVLMRNDHVLARKRGPISWADLDGHDIIGVTEDTATRPILSQIPDLPRSVAVPRYEISMNSMLSALLNAGIGVTPAPAASLFGETGHIIFRPLANPTMWRSIYIVTRRERASPPSARDLISLVKLRVRDMAHQSPLMSTSGSG
jgi:LysR family carnitine catabolism transcriptional activator